MQIMMLAAGRSSRLGPLGQQKPKPLVPVCGHAAISFGLALCRQAGFTDVVINLHHEGGQIEQHVRDGADFGVRVRYSHESELLDTGGGVVRARPLFRSEPIMVLNAKVVAEMDLAAIAAAFDNAGADVEALMVVRPLPAGQTFAPVEVDARGRVIAIRGQKGSVPAQGQSRPCLFTGVHILSTRLLDRLPKSGPSDVIADGYLKALQEGAKVVALQHFGYFAEHSTPERYLAGSLDLLAAPHLLTHPPSPLVGIDADALVDATARIVQPVRIKAGAMIEAGCTVGPNVVLDTGAVAKAGAKIKNAVVWPGGVAIGELQNVVVTQEGVVTV